MANMGEEPLPEKVEWEYIHPFEKRYWDILRDKYQGAWLSGFCAGALMGFLIGLVLGWVQ